MFSNYSTIKWQISCFNQYFIPLLRPIKNISILFGLGTKWIINRYIDMSTCFNKLLQGSCNNIILSNSNATSTRYLRLRSDSVKALDERSKREKCYFILCVGDAQHSFWWKHFSRFIQINLKGIKSCIRWSRINSNTFISSAKSLCVRFRMIYLY